MIVQVVKEGKEHSQGIAYLDDGTMIVVDGDKKHMGETIRVLVHQCYKLQQEEWYLENQKTNKF